MSAEAALCFLGYCTDAKPSIQEDDKTKCANRSSLPVILPASVLVLDGWTQTAWKGQGAVKIGTGDAQPQLPAGGRTPPRQPQSQTVLYHVVAMKAAGVRMGWPCSFFAEARRLVFIQLNRTWRSFWVGGDLWVSWRMGHLDPAGCLDKKCGR